MLHQHSKHRGSTNPHAIEKSWIDCSTTMENHFSNERLSVLDPQIAKAKGRIADLGVRPTIIQTIVSSPQPAYC
jgi:hypothetical protein